MVAQKIILGKGVFSIGDTPIALTRGGGQFTVEREVRQIEADGDRGPVKGRTVIDKSVPKLIMNVLEAIPENLPKMYAGLKATKGEGKTVITGTSQIADSDYQEFVKWTGKTKDGKGVVIKVYNAINLENFDWTLADKDEVISALSYTGCYLDNSPQDYEPWEVEFAD